MDEIKRSVDRFISDHGPLYLINLPSRTDRRAEFGTQLNKIGLSFDHPSIQVFPAIRPDELAGFPTLGTRGCFLSHMSVLERALSDGAKSVIICEDDLDFAPDLQSRLPVVLDVLERDHWDFFYAGYVSEQFGHAFGPEANIFRLPPTHSVICAHFYIIRGKAIADFHEYLVEILKRPTGHPDGGPMHYDGAINHFRRDRPDLVALATLPTLGFQRSSRTDIHALRWFDRTPFVRDVVQFLRRMTRR